MKLAIFGYGNLGRGVEAAVLQNRDVELYGIFTRRDPKEIRPESDVPVFRASDTAEHKNRIDVMVVCAGSRNDLPRFSPELAKDFCLVDSYDNHSAIAAHFSRVDAAAKKGGTLALVSCGWDPGLFSLARAWDAAVLPAGKSHTFWGRGVSQGHSEALRQIDGVLDARAYTVPKEALLDQIRQGEEMEPTAYEKHRRVCYIVPQKDADQAKIERVARSMPDYFANYETDVYFITEEEMQRNHASLSHKGVCVATGCVGSAAEKCRAEVSLTLGSNPDFTGSVLVACARAAYRMRRRGEVGARTVLDIRAVDLLPMTADETRKTYL